ncbi:MAG: hypothetical protein GY755_22410 [Chloroflexi bacterium]|nr:hypothetical protein [Chloroflexota bacterium]
MSDKEKLKKICRETQELELRLMAIRGRDEIEEKRLLSLAITSLEQGRLYAAEIVRKTETPIASRYA